MHAEALVLTVNRGGVWCGHPRRMNCLPISFASVFRLSSQVVVLLWWLKNLEKEKAIGKRVDSHRGPRSSSGRPEDNTRASTSQF
jgi:hypothetical protein